MRVTFSQVPFPHIIIDNFLGKEKLLELRKVLDGLPFSRKESDLFSLEQTGDLTGVFPGFEERLLALKQVIAEKLRRDVNRIDMSAMRYSQRDHLLCHDDELESRKVAYIWYARSPRRGGALALLDKKKPYTRKRIEPKEDRLLLFQVSAKSWHEVEEVRDGLRLSLGGWFH